MLDEKSLRRPGVVEADCVPVVLADGQAWLFPKPHVDYTPRYEDGRAVLAVESEFLPFLERIDAAETVAEDLCARFDLARAMLLRAYDLADDQVAPLLRTRRDSEADAERWQSILRAAAGYGPKPSPDGGS